MKSKPIKVPVLKITQPIGEFYVGVMSSLDLIQISSADMRRIEDGDDRLVGIQRKLNPSRVVEIEEFVNSLDGTFPTSVVLSIPDSFTTISEDFSFIEIHDGIDIETGEKISVSGAANILDGQHRIEGLKGLGSGVFEVPVSLFINADLADEAYIFATVNLAQTKVNKSLVYDLLDYAKSPSPQKSCHDIVVALDAYSQSPFYERIKRLGTATHGRKNETLAQATVVMSLISLISEKPETDRYQLAKNKSLSSDFNKQKTPLRPIWLRGHDTEIAKLLITYFNAIKNKWPEAWDSQEKGNILPRTNGFRAFMRLLRDILNNYSKSNPDSADLVSKSYIDSVLDKINLTDRDFVSSRFLPGTSGETSLYVQLKSMAGL